MARIYLASSWRNTYQPALVAALRGCNHDVYDFRNPPNKSGFAWRDADPQWEQWTTEEYVHKLQRSPTMSYGFLADYRAMQWADTGVLLLPCGRSAHIEAGYFNGANKRLIIYIPEPKIEPELMYLMANHIVTSEDELFSVLGNF